MTIRTSSFQRDNPDILIDLTSPAHAYNSARLGEITSPAPPYLINTLRLRVCGGVTHIDLVSGGAVQCGGVISYVGAI